MKTKPIVLQLTARFCEKAKDGKAAWHVKIEPTSKECPALSQLRKKAGCRWRASAHSSSHTERARRSAGRMTPRIAQASATLLPLSSFTVISLPAFAADWQSEDENLPGTFRSQMITTCLLLCCTHRQINAAI